MVGARTGVVDADIGECAVPMPVETFAKPPLPRGAARMKVGVPATAIALGSSSGSRRGALCASAGRARSGRGSPSRASRSSAPSSSSARSTRRDALGHGATPQLYAAEGVRRGGLRFVQLSPPTGRAARRGARDPARRDRGRATHADRVSAPALGRRPAKAAAKRPHPSGGAGARVLRRRGRVLRASAAGAYERARPRCRLAPARTASDRAWRRTSRSSQAGDALRSRGISLPRTFPSWVSILTGRHGHHHGIRLMFPTWEERAGLRTPFPLASRPGGICHERVAATAGISSAGSRLSLGPDSLFRFPAAHPAEGARA